MLLLDKTAQAWRSLRASHGGHAIRPCATTVAFAAMTIVIYSTATAALLTLLSRATTIPIVSDFWFWGITWIAGMIALSILALQVRDLGRWNLWEGLALDEPLPGASDSSRD